MSNAHHCDPHGPGGALTESRVYRLMLALSELDWGGDGCPPVDTSERVAVPLPGVAAEEPRA